MGIRGSIWGRQDGLVWRLTNGLTQRSRARRFDLFMNALSPSATTSVLDVGVSNRVGRATNFFEELYPWRANITAVAHGKEREFDSFRATYPEVTLVLADGRDLPFADNQFDIVFTNAVIEHVGTRAQQRLFLSECLRVGRVMFLATPNVGFPVDAHTLVPFVHWFPERPRNAAYRRLGFEFWADVQHLNLLGRRSLLSLLPEGTRWRMHEDRMFGVTASFALVGTKGSGGG